MPRVFFTRQAAKTMRRMPANTAKVSGKKIDQIAADPYATHNNVKKLRGREGYRLRVGDWRVIYEIRDEELIILVLRIGPRGEVYR